MSGILFLGRTCNIVSCFWKAQKMYRLSERWEETFFLFLFRLRTVRNSKFSASRLWQRTDRCLMPWRYGIGYPNAGKRHFFLFLFRLRTVRNSKFSASRLWQRTDRCLIPWRYGMLYALALAGTFWGFRVLYSGRLCAPNPG